MFHRNIESTGVIPRGGDYEGITPQSVLIEVR